ncbi:MAG: hypothetical protein ABI692_04330 [Terracoccus sp.]
MSQVFVERAHAETLAAPPLRRTLSTSAIWAMATLPLIFVFWVVLVLVASVG